MIKKLTTGAEKLFPRLHPANGVFEFWNVSLGDVDQVFLHLLDMLGLDKARDFPGRFLVKQLDVCLHHFAGDGGDWFVEKGGVELWKDPGVTDSPATNHKSGGLGFLEISEAGEEVDDIAIGDDRTGKLFDGLANFLRMNGRLVSFSNSSPVNSKEINGVLFKHREEAVEFVG